MKGARVGWHKQGYFEYLSTNNLGFIAQDVPKKGAAVNHGVQASVKEVSVFEIVIGEV